RGLDVPGVVPGPVLDRRSGRHAEGAAVERARDGRIGAVGRVANRCDAAAAVERGERDADTGAVPAARTGGAAAADRGGRPSRVDLDPLRLRRLDVPGAVPGPV